MEWVEGFLLEEGLSFTRTPEGDLSFSLNGDWRTFDLWFSYRPESEAIQLCCALDLLAWVDTPLAQDRLLAMSELICLLNQHVWFGHFELYKTEIDDAEPTITYDAVFRLTLPFASSEHGAFGAFAHMINTVTDAVERFLPAFSFWFKGAQTADEAFAACLFETQGEA